MSKLKLKRFANSSSSAQSTDRRFSPQEDLNKKFRVTGMDIFEFNAWEKGRLKGEPRLLRDKFNGDAKKYEDYMVNYQQRTFSEIKDDEAFRKYAHTIMKEAHGDKYSEEITNKVVDDLLKDHKGAEYGELIGRLTSGFGEERSYSAEALESGFTFNLMPTETCICIPQLVGNLLLSVTAIHMYHLCEHNYAGHIALDEYYSELPSLVDSLAEHYLGDVDHCEFTVSITPGACPIEYLEALKAYCAQFSGMPGITSDYQSQIDAIMEQIDSTLYKLKRLQ